MAETLAHIAKRIFANDATREFIPARLQLGNETVTEVRTAEGEIVKFHPSLSTLPLMDKEEMTRLVKSIKARGLWMPIVRDAEGVIIDGRCRLIACELAGVPPRFETMPEGWDPVDYMCAMNIERQDLGKQQKAMLLALLDTEEEEAGDSSLALARIIVRHAGEKSALVQKVCDGIYSLADALEQVKREEDAASATQAKALRLRTMSSALADRVSDGELSLDEALSQFEDLDDLAARIREEHQAARECFKRGAEHAINAGCLLIEAKDRLVHGQWGPWLKANCEISDRTARLYMQAARGRGTIEAKTAAVADLTLRGALKLLAAPADEDDQGDSTRRERAIIAKALPLILQKITDESERADFESRVKQYLKG